MKIEEAINKVKNLPYKPYIEIDNEEAQAIDIILEEVDKLQQLNEKAEKLRKYLEG